ncbi:hypothetical protein RN001_007216 [Aquatica leii]|uniref:lysozyme n=1 Tax=Aquatica leii TaxID=1421715 RepID=A0AAN7P2I1_9COLE|nr:hypothetical protein RN001_007216 [Aquatica leii]
MASGNWTYNNHPPEAHQSFIKCATNFYCSVITVQQYMKKFKKDCNGDGKVNCDDFAAIHALGPDLCHTPWPKRYKQDFELIDEPVSIRCINCLCQAATACNLKGICRGELCGPFGITKNYWLEANSPTVHRVASTDPAAFETCMGSAFCNYFVLQRYMEKYKKDCNGDGKIDCDDFAAILRLGPEKCDGELPENYQDRYDYCQALVQD